MSLARSRIKILPRAMREITQQADYYRREATPEVAARWRDEVNDAIRSLCTLPERGAVLELTQPLNPVMRKLHIKGFPKHLIFYRWNKEENTVFIVSVVHGARNFESLYL